MKISLITKLVLYFILVIGLNYAVDYGFDYLPKNHFVEVVVHHLGIFAINFLGFSALVGLYRRELYVAIILLAYTGPQDIDKFKGSVAIILSILIALFCIFVSVTVTLKLFSSLFKDKYILNLLVLAISFITSFIFAIWSQNRMKKITNRT